MTIMNKTKRNETKTNAFVSYAPTASYEIDWCIKIHINMNVSAISPQNHRKQATASEFKLISVSFSSLAINSFPSLWIRSSFQFIVLIFGSNKFICVNNNNHINNDNEKRKNENDIVEFIASDE